MIGRYPYFGRAPYHLMRYDGRRSWTMSLSYIAILCAEICRMTMTCLVIQHPLERCETSPGRSWTFKTISSWCLTSPKWNHGETGTNLYSNPPCTLCCWAAAITHEIFLNGSICQASTFFFFRITTWAVADLGSFSNCLEGSSRFNPSDPKKVTWKSLMRSQSQSCHILTAEGLDVCQLQLKLS